MNNQSIERATRHNEHQIGFWVQPELKRKLKEIAKIERRSVSNLLNRIVESYMESYENSEKL